MQSEEVIALLKAQLPDSDIEIEGEGCNFGVRVVSHHFDGLNAVKRQQAVYAALNARIADGSIHALTIRAYTPDEWARR